MSSLFFSYYLCVYPRFLFLLLPKKEVDRVRNVLLSGSLFKKENLGTYKEVLCFERSFTVRRRRKRPEGQLPQKAQEVRDVPDVIERKREIVAGGLHISDP